MHGVRGIDHVAAGFFPLDDLKDGQSLPDGAVVLVDAPWTMAGAAA